MTPYKEGARAYWENYSLESNPYSPDVEAHFKWEDGFVDARALDNGDEEDEYNTHPANENNC